MVNDGTSVRGLGGIVGMRIGEPDWEQRYLTMKAIADKRLEFMGTQDEEIAELRRECARLRGELARAVDR